jgi:cyclohexanone monooxygenase
MIESHVAYIVDAISHLKTHGVVSAEPTAEAQARFTDDLQARMQRTVWSVGGCASWYLDEHGRNVTLWPRATFTFRRLLQAFDADNYELVARKDVRVRRKPVATDIDAPTKEEVTA